MSQSTWACGQFPSRTVTIAIKGVFCKQQFVVTSELGVLFLASRLWFWTKMNSDVTTNSGLLKASCFVILATCTRGVHKWARELRIICVSQVSNSILVALVCEISAVSASDPLLWIKTDSFWSVLQVDSTDVSCISKVLIFRAQATYQNSLHHIENESLIQDLVMNVTTAEQGSRLHCLVCMLVSLLCAQDQFLKLNPVSSVEAVRISHNSWSVNYGMAVYLFSILCHPSLYFLRAGSLSSLVSDSFYDLHLIRLCILMLTCLLGQAPSALRGIGG